MSRLRRSLGIAAAVGALAWLSEIPGSGGSGDAARQLPQPAASRPDGSVELRLPQRELRAASRDPFNLPSEAPPRQRPVAVVAPPPSAPALPYQYDGFGEVQGKRFVLLKREERSFRAGPGDTLEGTYSVEAVARDHAVLRYLPLGIRQVLMYQPGAELPAELAEGPAAGRPLALRVEMPAEVVLGQEFVVTFSLPGPSPAKATVEVGYDVEVLRLFGAKQRRGRETVELAGAGGAQLRFKVVADSPAPTDINVQANATDTSGKHVPVSTPSTYTISLVHAGGA